MKFIAQNEEGITIRVIICVVTPVCISTHYVP